jgi:hypothetical protein
VEKIQLEKKIMPPHIKKQISKPAVRKPAAPATRKPVQVKPIARKPSQSKPAAYKAVPKSQGVAKLPAKVHHNPQLIKKTSQPIKQLDPRPSPGYSSVAQEQKAMQRAFSKFDDNYDKYMKKKTGRVPLDFDFLDYD